MTDKFDEKLTVIINKYHELNERIANIDNIKDRLADIAKERSELEPIANLAEIYKLQKVELENLKQLQKDEDKSMAKMAEEEYIIVEKKIASTLNALKIMLLPKDANDENDVIIEIRAGTGGEEAALFAAILFNMYHKYAEKNRWGFEILSLSETGLNGYKEAIAKINGKGVFAKLKFESGIHRVQRIPTTEANDRIHTSAVTVAILPIADDVDIKIDDKDLKIDVYRSSGAGGQHVNTTDSAVRITHLPTKTVVCVQDGRSQHQNKAKAMQILRARIYEQEMSKQAEERSNLKKNQVGSGDRSGRIRTYNYPQSRVTDHRINMTLHYLDKVVEEGLLDEIIEGLIADYQSSKLAEEF
jgi:peptide chain release factor 1